MIERERERERDIERDSERQRQREREKSRDTYVAYACFPCLSALYITHGLPKFEYIKPFDVTDFVAAPTKSRLRAVY